MWSPHGNGILFGSSGCPVVSLCFGFSQVSRCATCLVFKHPFQESFFSSIPFKKPSCFCWWPLKGLNLFGVCCCSWDHPWFVVLALSLCHTCFRVALRFAPSCSLVSPICSVVCCCCCVCCCSSFTPSSCSRFPSSCACSVWAIF